MAESTKFIPRTDAKLPAALGGISDPSDENLSPSPFQQFDIWFQDAVKAGEPIPEAMTLATSDRKGYPTGRVLLLKTFGEKGFVFFTNYQSRKGHELIENPFATIIFHWPRLQRQVRIEGRIKKTTRKESQEYFHTRPRESQIGAWASPQSSAIVSREFLEEEVAKLTRKFEGKEVPCPSHWGGYRLLPERIEFWQGRQARLHDRWVYAKKGRRWIRVRLAP